MDGSRIIVRSSRFFFFRITLKLESTVTVLLEYICTSLTSIIGQSCIADFPFVKLALNKKWVQPLIVSIDQVVTFSRYSDNQC